MGYLFISYSSLDQDFVNRLLPSLNAAGYETWVDREAIHGGTMWRRQIVEGITGADAVLLLLSPNSVTSDNVRKELDIADEAKKPLLPIEAVRVVIPKEMTYQLAGVQRIDLATNFDRGVTRLLEALRQITEGGAPVSRQPESKAASQPQPQGEMTGQRAAPQPAAPLSEFDPVWFRPETKTSLLKAYSDSGRLVVTNNRVTFYKRKDAIEIDLHDIKTVELSRMSGDVANDWVVIRYGEPVRIAGFKDGSLMGWGRNTDQIFSAIKTAYEGQRRV
jgi:hypothetical protein